MDRPTKRRAVDTYEADSDISESVLTTDSHPPIAAAAKTREFADAKKPPLERRLSIEDVQGMESSMVKANVIKVFCNHKEPDFSRPWTFKRHTTSYSSGFVIDIPQRKEKFVLTNAHSVDFAATVQVRKFGESLEFDAKVLCIGHECDLALLTVEDEEFWDGLKPLDFGESPELQDQVIVVGYPIGGDNISVTQGVVSRIDLHQYTLGSLSLLAIQIDAAINAGNSGGPAINNGGECVGVAFQTLKTEDAENIGYIIPIEVIDHFLKDFVMNGKYSGFADSGIHWQRLKNKSMRRSLGLKQKRHGVLIKKVEKTSQNVDLLQPGDILLRVNDKDVASDGTIPFRRGSRIPFTWLISNMFVGATSPVIIARNGQEMKVTLNLGKFRLMVPTTIDPAAKAQYFIVGGFVFVPLSEPFLRSEYGENFECRAPVRLIDAWQYLSAEAEYEQVVLLSHVLAHDFTSGFEHLANVILRKFNGEKPRNVKHLAQLVQNCDSENYKFELDLEEVAVIGKKEADEVMPELLQNYMIPANMSENLLTQRDV
eukprot:GHVP01004391.1.p1 GENE.GHVP01004391.1~~GHVP01004391.1.p1  ORF type:complete len:541 (+),score=84.63 GHVP01004391.1:1740-3362(+)